MKQIRRRDVGIALVSGTAALLLPLPTPTVAQPNAQKDKRYFCKLRWFKNGPKVKVWIYAKDKLYPNSAVQAAIRVTRSPATSTPVDAGEFVFAKDFVVEPRSSNIIRFSYSLRKVPKEFHGHVAHIQVFLGPEREPTNVWNHKIRKISVTS